MCFLPTEEWEDGFRRDTNPDAEISVWVKIGQMYKATVESRMYNEDECQDIFIIVMACSRINTLVAIYPSLQLKTLDKAKANALISKFYKQFH